MSIPSRLNQDEMRPWQKTGGGRSAGGPPACSAHNLKPCNLRAGGPRSFWRCGAYALALFLMVAMPASAIVPWSLYINTNNIVVVTNIAYGAVGDNLTTNTTAIQAAINAASAGTTTNALIGGTVEIPPAPNAYLCGPLTLKKNVNLQIDAGAVLRMLSYSQYPGGIVSPANFISGSSLTNIEISGSGAIDGQGAAWWARAGS